VLASARFYSAAQHEKSIAEGDENIQPAKILNLG
jgi:hypothetical protein